MGFKMFLGSI